LIGRHDHEVWRRSVSADRVSTTSHLKVRSDANSEIFPQRRNADMRLFTAERESGRILRLRKVYENDKQIGSLCVHEQCDQSRLW